MKKYSAICLVIALCVTMLAGCGTSYSAEESTVFVQKHGKIVSTDVEDFDENTYDKDGLEKYVNETIDKYTSENGKNTVKLKELSVKDNSAVLTLEYKDAKAYSGFNGEELFTGTIAEALAAGYRFDTEFASVKDGKAGEAVDSSEFLDDDLKVVIVKANLDVNVKGKICYLSTQNTSLKDKSTVSIREGQNLLSKAEESEAGTQETEAAEAVTEVTETEESGSVDDDEMLTGTEEETSVTFDFPEEEENKDTSDEFSNVYTYIIYK